MILLRTANLRRHMDSMHCSEMKITCHICGRSFRSDAAIRKHLFVHSGERPFQCDLCSKKFARNDKLKQHRNSHFGVKSYHCDFCGKSYTQRFNLIIHKRSHVGVRYMHFLLFHVLLKLNISRAAKNHFNA